MEFIAIDIGTSFTKGAIVDVQSMEIRNISRRPGAAKLAAEDPADKSTEELEELLSRGRAMQARLAQASCPDPMAADLAEQVYGMVHRT